MTSTCTAVDSLPVALRLVSHAHQAAVLSHPAWIDIAEEADPALQLVWMVEKGLLSYDELDDLQTFEEETSERDRIVEEAFAVLGQHNTTANGRLLDQMLADRLITPGGHCALDSAQRQVNLQFALCLAGAALMTWFIVAHWPG